VIALADYPTSADDIDANWLTAALAPRHPGVSVTDVEVIDRHELTNAHAMLRVTYATAAGAPETMFCKLAPTDERRAAILATGMGEREARFYDSLAASMPMRVLNVHAARQDDETGLFVLLLEDLGASGCSVPDGTWGISADAAAVALEELAAFHARYFDAARRSAELSWVPVLGPGSRYGADMLRYGIDNHRDRLTDAFVAVSEAYIADQAALHALWHEGPPTVIHGDPHLGNLFLDGARVGFLDWGIINVNTPMRDVSYLMTMAMQPEDRRAAERDLLRSYLQALAAAGGPRISFDEAWQAHRIHASYTVPASCQVVTFPANASPGRRVFADSFLARAQACLDDLDAVGALRDRGIPI
jgi:hypothetical protein